MSELDELLTDERALADELADAHDLAVLKRRIAATEREDAVVLQLPARPRPRLPAIGILAAAAGFGGLVVAGGIAVLQPRAAPEEPAEEPAVTALRTPAAPPVTPPPIPESGELRLRVLPWAEVFIDGEPHGTTPLRAIQLPAGVHEVVLQTPWKTARRRVEILAGQRRDLRVDMRETAPVEVEPAYLTLTTKPWTRVTVDGRPVGATPLFKLKLAPGKHRVHMVNDDLGLEREVELNLHPGTTIRRSYKLTKKREALERLDKHAVLKVIKAGLPAVKRCGERHGVEGMVKVEFRVGPSGRTYDEQILSRDFIRTPVGDCVLGVVASWRFPRARTEPPPIRIPLKL